MGQRTQHEGFTLYGETPKHPGFYRSSDPFVPIMV